MTTFLHEGITRLRCLLLWLENAMFTLQFVAAVLLFLSNQNAVSFKETPQADDCLKIEFIYLFQLSLILLEKIMLIILY